MANVPGSPDELTVRRRVIRSIAITAAEEVPGVLRVGRGGPRPLAWLVGRPVSAWTDGRHVHIRLWLIVRPGEALPSLSRRVRTAVSQAVEHQLGLDLGEVIVLVDGVGG
ncbi:MAG TPA: Asp23/Gls24 family envelope stress response protein [Candidatus Saccharimonadia bacterium]|nr:Asp23/Gls24 family envelope stress response protein [Candidatus Saccharimonadia bacterium]